MKTTQLPRPAVPMIRRAVRKVIARRGERVALRWEVRAVRKDLIVSVPSAVLVVSGAADRLQEAT